MTQRKNPAAVALGSLGGKANTEAQNAARRENGKKGGRPRNKKLRTPLSGNCSAVCSPMGGLGKRPWYPKQAATPSLESAAWDMLHAVEAADAAGELAENIGGELIDALRAALEGEKK